MEYTPEHDADERGHVSAFGIPRPSDETTCMICARQPGKPQRCPGDGAHHRHGMIHVLRDGNWRLLWACDECTKHEHATRS